MTDVRGSAVSDCVVAKAIIVQLIRKTIYVYMYTSWRMPYNYISLPTHHAGCRESSISSILS